ncbi:MAG: glutamate-1-semialdehyde 2,1-aminomutase [Chlamydiales bacterium]
MLKTTEERPLSANIYRRAVQVIPEGVNSPVRSFPGMEQTPLVVQSGKGERIIDEDERQYIDCCCSWGALIHGHAHPRVVEGAVKRCRMGSTFGITTEIEARLATKVVELVPSIEKIRFVSSGTEATMSALRLARGYTRRDLIIKFAGHYHGHSDSLLVQAGSGVAHLSATASSAGVPEDFVKHTVVLNFNEIDKVASALRELGDRVAAVILEPIAANMGVVEPLPGFLEMLRTETAKTGALLIFDEVITGFRVAHGGAQELYGIESDLTCLGKIVGGGFPAAAFGGRADIMDHIAPRGEVYQAGTLSGNPVAMEAGYQTLYLLEREEFYQELEAKTDVITKPVRELIARKGLDVSINQAGSLFTLFFGQKKVENFVDAKRCNLDLFRDYFHHAFARGVYLSPSQFEANFISQAHQKESLGQVRDVILEFLDGL